MNFRIVKNMITIDQHILIGKTSIYLAIKHKIIRNFSKLLCCTIFEGFHKESLKVILETVYLPSHFMVDVYEFFCNPLEEVILNSVCDKIAIGGDFNLPHINRYGVALN